MADLIAQGTNTGTRWRRPLPPDQPFEVGREAPPWSVPWDEFISRRHARLLWRDGCLEVARLPNARNPVYFDGREATEFRVGAGGSFVIGKTTFTVADESLPVNDEAAQVIKKRTFTAQELKKARVSDAAHQIDVLARLPEVISGAADERELHLGLINLLLAGIDQAEAVALVSTEARDGARPAVRVLAWDRRLATQGGVQPSSRLIQEAVRQQDTVMHVWAGGANRPASTSESGLGSYTQDTGFDWAFCTPVRTEGSTAWGIYVAGGFGGRLASSVLEDKDTSGLLDDLKFTGLVASIWDALQQVNQLKHRQATLSQFFSPAVLGTLSTTDPEVALKPRKADVTVLFCDLRGFSRESEKRELLSLLEGVSRALGFMTQNILDHGGVIGDFHGDAAMGFWGWPIPHPDTVKHACLAALGVRAAFETVQEGEAPVGDFHAGIGIASGTAVAGKIGTHNQVKVTVFGPVVNLASRLEGMTKILRVPILLDETTSRMVREQVPPEVARLRRLAVCRPYGLDTALMVSELLPPVARYPLLTDAHLADFEAAVDAFMAGDWPRAYELLLRLPPQDRGKDFLIAFIIQNNHRPPPGWDGVIPLSSKG
jgi:adenylate cyclase